MSTTLRLRGSGRPQLLRDRAGESAIVRRVYDGDNIHVGSVPCLVVNDATADGERYIVNHVSQQIHGFVNGKVITVVHGTVPLSKPTAPDPAVVNAQIKRLSDMLGAFTARCL